eukprot:5060772-Prymnesium_polylepis.1
MLRAGLTHHIPGNQNGLDPSQHCTASGSLDSLGRLASVKNALHTTRLQRKVIWWDFALGARSNVN